MLKNYRFIYIVLFLICPLFSVSLLFLDVLSSKTKNLSFFAIMMAFYISFINITKSTFFDQDLTWYSEGFLDAGKSTFSDYIFSFGMNGKGRELFFPMMNYILYYFIGPHLLTYRLILSLMCYLLAFWGIMKIGEFLKLGCPYVALTITWFSCFPWIFTYSEMLLRQFFAASLLIFVVNLWCIEKKLVASIILSLVMILSHTSALFFVPFLFIPFFSRPLRGRTVLLYIIAFSSLLFIQRISRSLSVFWGSGDNVLSYAFSRAAKNTTFELPPLGFEKIAFLLLLISVMIWSLYFRPKSHVLVNKRDVLISNIIIILCVFILINLSQTELSNRFFMYAACLSPIVILYALQKVKMSSPVILSIYSILQLMLIFYYTYSPYGFDIKYYIMFFPLNSLF